MNTKAIVRQLFTVYKKRGALSFFAFIATAVNDSYVKKHLRGSFSQKGEDLIIEKLIGKKKKGFYIDVGAHNPNVFNNTKRFYIKGWSGINVEPNPHLIKEFKRVRRRDLNLNLGIGRKSGKAAFYEFETDLLSTFSKFEKEKYLKLGYKLKQEYQIKVLSLKSLIEKYADKKIDFVSIDTEGLDFDVLASNDWNNNRPTLVCVETGDFNAMIKGKNSKKKISINSIMKKNGYEEVFTNGLNSIYKDTTP